MYKNIGKWLIISAVCAVIAVSFVPSGIQKSSGKVVVREISSEISVTTALSTEKSAKTAAKSEKTHSGKKNSPETSTTAVSATENIFPIDINTADREKLMLLDGIGEKLADSVIAYREENGGFLNIEQIMEVKGIGEGIFNANSDKIYVENPIYPTETEEITAFAEESVTEETAEEFPEEVTEEMSEEETPEETAFPININTADAETLMLLPFVNREKALEIIRIRDEIGAFSHPYEILLVPCFTREQAAEITKYIVTE